MKNLKFNLIALAVVFILSVSSMAGYSQEKQTKSEIEYLLLNKALEKYIESKHISDSLRNASELISDFDKNRFKLDTIYLKFQSSQRVFDRFFDNPLWDRQNRSEEDLEYFSSIFSPRRVASYKNQLTQESIVWDINKIKTTYPVVVVDDHSNIQDDKLFTFSKPIYSLDGKNILMTYQKNGHFVLFIFERDKNKIELKNYMKQDYSITTLNN